MVSSPAHPLAKLLLADARALFALQPDGHRHGLDLPAFLYQPAEEVLATLAAHNGPTSPSARMLAAWTAQKPEIMLLLVGILTDARHMAQCPSGT